LAFSKASSLLSAAITVAPSLWNNPLRFIQFLIHTLTLYLNLKPINDLTVFTYDYNELIVAKLTLCTQPHSHHFFTYIRKLNSICVTKENDRKLMRGHHRYKTTHT